MEAALHSMVQQVEALVIKTWLVSDNAASERGTAPLPRGARVRWFIYFGSYCKQSSSLQELDLEHYDLIQLARSDGMARSFGRPGEIRIPFTRMTLTA